MRILSLKKLIPILTVILLSGCSLQSSQLSSLIGLIKEPSLDLSANSWLVRYSGYESVVYAVSTSEGTLFSNKAGDKVLFDGWMVRKVSGLGRRGLDTKIDELDGILGTRNDFDQSLVNEVKTIFLSEMDGIISRNPNVIFIVATNKLHSIDKAIKRRMRLHIEVPLPDKNARKKILELHLKKYCLDIDSILKDTNGFSGSDLFELCKLAGLEAISNNRTMISNNDMNTALSILIN